MKPAPPETYLKHSRLLSFLGINRVSSDKKWRSYQFPAVKTANLQENPNFQTTFLSFYCTRLMLTDDVQRESKRSLVNVESSPMLSAEQIFEVKSIKQPKSILTVEKTPLSRYDLCPSDNNLFKSRTSWKNGGNNIVCSRAPSESNRV